MAQLHICYQIGQLSLSPKHPNRRCEILIVTLYPAPSSPSQNETLPRQDCDPYENLTLFFIYICKFPSIQCELA